MSDNDHALLTAGTLTTCGLLAAGHWFPWWRKLNRIQAYVYGVLAILVGQGLYMRWDQRWRKAALIACAAGTTVVSAYLYDTMANHTAMVAAGGDSAADGQLQHC